MFYNLGVWGFIRHVFLFLDCLTRLKRLQRAKNARFWFPIRAMDYLVLGLVEHGRSSKIESICYGSVSFLIISDGLYSDFSL